MRKLRIKHKLSTFSLKNIFQLHVMGDIARRYIYIYNNIDKLNLKDKFISSVNNWTLNVCTGTLLLRPCSLS